MNVFLRTRIETRKTQRTGSFCRASCMEWQRCKRLSVWIPSTGLNSPWPFNYSSIFPSRKLTVLYRKCCSLSFPFSSTGLTKTGVGRRQIRWSKSQVWKTGVSSQWGSTQEGPAASFWLPGNFLAHVWMSICLLQQWLVSFELVILVRLKTSYSVTRLHSDIVCLNTSLFWLQAAERLKVRAGYNWDSSAYRKYFDAFADGYNTMYKKGEESANDEESFMQTLPYALLLIVPVILVFTLVALKNAWEPLFSGSRAVLRSL